MRRKIIRRIYDLLGDEERKVFMIVGRSIITKVSGYKVLKNGKPMSLTTLPTVHLIMLAKQLFNEDETPE
jgi:hypothetical protein